jgi:hypothetical protein
MIYRWRSHCNPLGLRHAAENTSFQESLMGYIISKNLDLSSRLQHIHAARMAGLSLGLGATQT